MKRAVLYLAAVALLVAAGPVSAGPLPNQIVPIAEYVGPGLNAPFGLAYDPVTKLIWSKSLNGNVLQSVRAFNTFTPLELSGMANGANGKIVTPAFSSIFNSTAPVGSLQALGYNPATGMLVIHTGGTGLGQFFPGGLAIPYGTLGAAPGFLDGLDIHGTDFYSSPEGGPQHGTSQKNGANFLSTLAQRDAMGIWTGPGDQFIDRWSGIEFVEGINRIFAVADMGGGGRTIASYDSSGIFLALDPDGSPFALRLEDLAFDGRYLYGSDFNQNKIFVFDIVGFGGLEIPEPTSLALLSFLGLSSLGYARWRRRSGRLVA